MQIKAIHQNYCWHSQQDNEIQKFIKYQLNSIGAAANCTAFVVIGDL